MRWPWSKRETRSAGGGYADAVFAAIEAQASAKVADVSATAAIEAASGALSRALAGCDVEAVDWARAAVDAVLGSPRRAVRWYARARPSA